ncbi:hypothetical protein RIF29_35090 [Crotalaria pallida]|uniref:Protein FAR1-RELATED SEQUENCE n=1 Tax=Crotalaria pallida TaxID=3830 RepID=A0AAN9EFI0_CROPI
MQFIYKFEHVLREYRHNELEADYKSLFTEPVLTTSLKKIEREASKIYTLAIFKEVKDEIVKTGTYVVSERTENGDKLIIKLSKYCKRDCVVTVNFDPKENHFSCDYHLFESRGIPCSHIICTLKNEHVDYIPASLICKRWTKTAKSDYISSIGSEQEDSDFNKVARLGAVAAAHSRLGEIVASKRDLFKGICDDLLKLVNKYENLAGTYTMHTSSGQDIGDPTVVKTKGAPKKRKDSKKRRWCSHCNNVGHTISTCPKRLSENNQYTKDDNLAPSNSLASDSEHDNHKEGSQHDEDKLQPSMPKNQSKTVDDKNVKEKLGQNSKRKGNKVKTSTQSSLENTSETRQGFQPNMTSGGSMPAFVQGIHPYPSWSGVRPEIPQGVYGFPHYGHGVAS